MKRLLVRLVLRRFGLGGTVLALALSLLSITAAVSGMALLLMGCVGGLFGLFTVDTLTATSARATVTGHYWERQIWPEVAELDSKGKLRWDSQSPVKREGETPSPAWPVVPDDRCTFLGCRRPGSRQEKYELRLKMADGAASSCVLDEQTWRQFAVGSALSVRVGGITGIVSCRSSTPEARPEEDKAPPPQRRPRGRGRRGGV
jgi:hypothetical protein